jgi:hypothetical protein
LTLLVINKSPTLTFPVNITLNGFTPSGSLHAYSYGIPQDEAARTGVGSADVSDNSYGGGGPSFAWNFAPYSATVLSLSGALPGIAPILSGASKSGDGKFHFTVNASASQNYIVQASSDLKTWDAIQTLTAAPNVFVVTDASTAGLTERFYRVQLQQ